MEFNELVETVGKAIDLSGVGVIVVAAVVATARYVAELGRRGDGLRAYRRYRQRIGRGILLGLEFLVAADIIRTIAVEPSFRGVGVLAIIVVIRTFLSFTLEVELEGRWPCQERRAPTSSSQ